MLMLRIHASLDNDDCVNELSHHGQMQDPLSATTAKKHQQCICRMRQTEEVGEALLSSKLLNSPPNAIFNNHSNLIV